jgi:hypothetical protein
VLLSTRNFHYPADRRASRVRSGCWPIRSAAWKAFAEDPAAELRAAFSQLDESPDQTAPDSDEIMAEIRAWRTRR